MRAAWLLGVVAAALIGLPGCRESKPAAAPTTVPPTAPPTTEPAGPSTFTLGPVEVATVGDAPPEFPDWARAGVQNLLDAYLANAVLRPLRTGEPAGNLGTVFGSPAFERLNGPDRAALVDEGLPKAEHVRVDTATATITAMTGLSVVSAGITLLLTARVSGTPVRIERTGELQLTTDGSRWTITGYGVRVTRDTPDTTTTAVSTTVAGHP